MTDPASTPPTTVAAFDFDGTLTEGGSVFPFLVALCGIVPVLRATLRYSPQLVHAALVGGTTADEAKALYLTRLLKGIPAAQVDRAAAVFARRHLERKLRPRPAARLKWHVGQGHHVVIVSASPECYVLAAGTQLQVDGAIATKLAVDESGKLTGGYEGKNCRGEEKLNRLMSHLSERGLIGPDGQRPELWAYGNSRGDLRLLQAADHGVDVGKLGKWGKLRQFPRLSEVD
jgi:phosphatidylglycerophosphatase C